MRPVTMNTPKSIIALLLLALAVGLASSGYWLPTAEDGVEASSAIDKPGEVFSDTSQHTESLGSGLEVADSLGNSEPPVFEPSDRTSVTAPSDIGSGQNPPNGAATSDDIGLISLGSGLTTPGSNATADDIGLISLGLGQTTQGSGATSDDVGLTSLGLGQTTPGSGATSDDIGLISHGSAQTPPRSDEASDGIGLIRLGQP